MLAGGRRTRCTPLKGIIPAGPAVSQTLPAYAQTSSAVKGGEAIWRTRPNDKYLVVDSPSLLAFVSIVEAGGLLVPGFWVRILPVHLVPG